jgi:hypothetical protein
MGRGIIAASSLNRQLITDDYVRTDLLYYIDATKTESYSGTGTVINDLSGNNRTTNIVNGLFLPEKAIRFNSENSYFGSFSLAVSQGGYSFESYLKVTSLNPFGNPGFFRVGNEFLVTTGGTNRFWLRTNNVDVIRNIAQAAFPINVYFHVVLTIDINNIRFYLNGSILHERVNTTISPSKPNVNGFTLNAFNLQQSVRENIFADYKNILFYDKALIASEVLQNYDHFTNLYNS